MMIYDVIIIGGGAAGLFCGASYKEKVNGLILEKTKSVGKKLLMSGGGQCNLTHGGDIKNFLTHYGDNGKKIRNVLYKFNNKCVCDFFKNKGIEILEREDGKIFPRSLQAKDVLEVLRRETLNNGFDIKLDMSVDKVEFASDIYEITCNEGKNKTCYKTRKIIIGTGGCSYPTTGSDGSMLKVLEDMGIEIIRPKPALVPVFVQDYPYSELSGISISPAKIKLGKFECQDDLLFTHKNFSGPVIINSSRFIDTGKNLLINYFPGKTFQEIFSELKKKVTKNSKQTNVFLLEYMENTLPKRFIDVICKRANIVETRKVSTLTGNELKRIAELLTMDSFSVSGTGGFNTAMATAGGVALSEINLKNMECKKYPGLFFIGEVVDIDGDTGGYNLQFAFSSGYLAGNME
ncbi:MAG: NAD(P)/FAD-dependent oxidoreductase [Aminipila sp.]